MINPRSIATLGIGFGIAAIAAIGLISDQQQTVQADLGGGGGWGGRSSTSSVFINGKRELPQKEYLIKIQDNEEEDEDAIVMMVLAELTQLGLFT
jgi:hypothetical protein